MAKQPVIPVSDEPEKKIEETPKPLTPAEIAAPKPPGEFPSNIPTVEIPEAASTRYLGQPPANEAYKGQYKQASTGLLFALAVLPVTESDNGKTHFLKNNAYSWNGTAGEFREQFEKV